MNRLRREATGCCLWPQDRLTWCGVRVEKLLRCEHNFEVGVPPPLLLCHTRKHLADTVHLTSRILGCTALGSNQSIQYFASCSLGERVSFLEGRHRFLLYERFEPAIGGSQPSALCNGKHAVKEHRERAAHSKRENYPVSNRNKSAAHDSFL